MQPAGRARSNLNCTPVGMNSRIVKIHALSTRNTTRGFAMPARCRSQGRRPAYRRPVEREDADGRSPHREKKSPNSFELFLQKKGAVVAKSRYMPTNSLIANLPQLALIAFFAP